MKPTLQFSGGLQKALTDTKLLEKTLNAIYFNLLSMTYHSKYLFMNSVASKILPKWYPFVPNNPKLPKTNRKIVSILKYLQSSNNKALQVTNICSHRLRNLTPRHYSYRNCTYLGGRGIGENFH